MMCIFRISTYYDLIMFSVKDSGIGMNEDIKNKLFQINAGKGRQGTDGES